MSATDERNGTFLLKKLECKNSASFEKKDNNIDEYTGVEYNII